MTRIKSLTESTESLAMKMTEGNPGALRVFCEIVQQGAAIDPDDALGPMGAILALDTLGIYGPRIWILYNNVCGGSLILTMAVVRSWQLGYTPMAVLQQAIDAYGEGFSAAEAHRKVKERLPAFADNPSAAHSGERRPGEPKV